MLLHSDGFDSYAPGVQELEPGNEKYSTGTSAEIVGGAGRFGGNALELGGAGFGLSSGVALFGLPNQRFASAAHVKLKPWPGSGGTADILEANYAAPILRVKQDGSIDVMGGNAGGVLATAPAGTLMADTWAWLEVAFTASGCYLYKDGMQVAAGAGAAVFASLAVASVNWSDNGSGDGHYVDDWLLWDDQGTYFNSFGLAPRRISLLQATADGDVNDWTPAGGSNHASVTGPDWDGGAGVTSTVAGQKDLYALGDLPYTPGAIDAVVVRTRVENTGAGFSSTTPVIRGADDAEASAFPNGLDAGWIRTGSGVFYRDGNGAPFTPTSVNALQVGLVSGT